jgi:uncharacterized protein YqeY
MLTHLARMPLLDTINQDLKKAMLARDEVARETLRMLKSELLTLDDPDEMAVLTRAVKSRRESAQSYRDAGRDDLAQKEEAEIAVIERYLPKQLSEQEAHEAITKIVADLAVTSRKDLGKVMKEVMARHRGQIDGKRASAIATELLD